MKQKLTEDDRRALVAIYCDKDTTDEFYPKAEAFIQAIEELINNSGK